MSNLGYSKIGIVGAGCYGTAIAQCFSNSVKSVLLLSDKQEITDEINNRHSNSVLGNTLLNANISCSMDFSEMKDCDIIFIAVPVSVVVDVSLSLKKHNLSVPIILCSKGLDIDNARLISECVEEVIENEIAIFSGPSFADEIVRGLPFGVNIASKNSKLSEKIAEFLSTEICRIKHIDDYIGLQIAGALKNVLAVGCGIIRGSKLGNSAIAQFIVEGLEEVISLAVAMGGCRDTFFELCGIGDIILTCTSTQSRNILFGEYVAQGGNLNDWNSNLAEGAYTARAIPLLENKYNIKLNILKKIYTHIYS